MTGVGGCRAERGRAQWDTLPACYDQFIMRSSAQAITHRRGAENTEKTLRGLGVFAVKLCPGLWESLSCKRFLFQALRRLRSFLCVFQ